MARDEIGLAHTIGAGIAKGTGSIPLLKSKDDDKKSKTAKKTVVKGEIVKEKETPAAKPEPEIVDAEVISERPFRQPHSPKKELTYSGSNQPKTKITDVSQRPLRRRDATFKDTIEAIKGGHIERLDAIQISPTYAKKYATKVEDELFMDSKTSKKKAPAKKKKK